MALPGAHVADVDTWLAGMRPQVGEFAILDDERSGEQALPPEERAPSAATTSGPETWLVPAIDRGLLHPSSGGQVFTVRSELATPEGARFIREAVAELTRDPRRPFVFHEWRHGESPSPANSS